VRLPPASAVRTQATLFTVAALALYAVFSFYGAVRLQPPDPYQMSAQLERFSAVRAALPEGSTLCYLSDVPFGETRGAAMFFGAQYALAPFPLRSTVTKDSCRLVLGNFSKPVDSSAVLPENNLALLHDFGSGVLLFRPLAK
jgi:hypothetical protein